jgi:hypothetical protein
MQNEINQIFSKKSKYLIKSKLKWINNLNS